MNVDEKLFASRIDHSAPAATNIEINGPMTRIVAHAAMMTMGSLVMIGCAVSGDADGLLDDGATDEFAQAIDAVAPAAPQDPSTDVVVKIVCPTAAPGCHYSSLQTAINDAQPGWTLLVKNGTYYTPDATVANGRTGLVTGYKHGTATQPISLVAFPGHRPIIETLSDTVTVTNLGPAYHSTASCLVLTGDYWIVDGFEVRRCNTGIVVSGSNITLRNNNIHDNAYQGILVSARRYPSSNSTAWRGASDLLIEQNRIHANGITYETTGAMPRQHCLFNETQNGVTYYKPSPGHCHGIYLSANDNGAELVTDQERITIRRNIIERHGGGAVHIYDNRSTGAYSNILIENNLLLNNQKGGMLGRYEYGLNSHFRNNVVSIDAPVTLKSEQYALNNNNKDIYLISPLQGASADGMQVYNNIFYTPYSWWSIFANMPTTHAYAVVVDAVAAGKYAPVFAENFWAVRGGARVDYNANQGHGFIWKGTWYSSFSTEFRSNAQVAQESAGILPGDPSFIAAPFLRPERARYEHVNASPALGRGLDSAARPCPLTDYTGRVRSDGACDLGAFED